MWELKNAKMRRYHELRHHSEICDETFNDVKTALPMITGRYIRTSSNILVLSAKIFLILSKGETTIATDITQAGFHKIE